MRLPHESSDGTATLAEIARAAGVSAPTVSKVLNGRADVAPGTRTKVEELLLLHGYRRRRGSTTQSQLIDLVFHELDSAWAMEVVRGVENVAREEGLSLVLSESAGRLTPGQTWVDGVLAHAAGRGDPGPVGPHRRPACPAHQPEHPVRGGRPGRMTPATTSRRSGRRTGRAGSPPPATSPGSGTAGSE